MSWAMFFSLVHTELQGICIISFRFRLVDTQPPYSCRRLLFPGYQNSSPYCSSYTLITPVQLAVKSPNKNVRFWFRPYGQQCGQDFWWEERPCANQLTSYIGKWREERKNKTENDLQWLPLMVSLLVLSCTHFDPARWYQRCCYPKK